MKIAYILAARRGETDAALAALADRLRAEGLACRGVVQFNRERPDAGPCDMDLKVLPDGPELCISQNLGRAARGCRLDPQALETAVALVLERLAAGADVLIVNKFGKHEAEGRGFRDVIAEAVAAEVPVVVGVNPLNLPAFLEFVGDAAEALPADVARLAAWVRAARGAPASAAAAPLAFT